MLFGEGRDGGGGLRSGQSPGRVGHGASSLIVTEQAVEFRRQAARIEFAVWYDHGGPYPPRTQPGLRAHAVVPLTSH